MGERKIEDILEDIVRRLAPPLPRSDGFLSLEEAAKFLGDMPPSTLAEKARNKLIPSYKPGKHVVFDPKDLREYVNRHKVMK